MSEEITRVITREQAEEWGLPHETVRGCPSPGYPELAIELAREFISDHRWHAVKRLIFTARDDGQTWGVTYAEGLTEAQEGTDPWAGQKEITLTRYEQYEKTVTAWRPVQAGA